MLRLVNDSDLYEMIYCAMAVEGLCMPASRRNLFWFHLVKSARLDLEPTPLPRTDPKEERREGRWGRGRGGT